MQTKKSFELGKSMRISRLKKKDCAFDSMVSKDTFPYLPREAIKPLEEEP